MLENTHSSTHEVSMHEFFPQVPLSILSGRNVCYYLFELARIVDKRMATTIRIG
jgi:hypothetical protein